jgi:NhaP-type Na+/H+ or K+/H+ antiporter
MQIKKIIFNILLICAFGLVLGLGVGALVDFLSKDSSSTTEDCQAIYDKALSCIDSERRAK